jgi:hypothetical protein
VRLAQNRRAAGNEAAVGEALLQSLLDVLLDAVHLEGREQLAVGELGQPRVLAAHPDERLHPVVPRLDVLVADGPVDAHSFLQVGFEIQIAPAEAVTRPQQGTTAHLVAPEPAEVLHRVVGVILVLHQEVLRVLAEKIEVLLDVVLLEVLARRLVPMGQLPGSEPGRRVVLHLLDVSASLEDQRSQARFGQLLRGPAPRDPGPHHDGVERVFGFPFGDGVHDVAHPFCPGRRSTHPR